MSNTATSSDIIGSVKPPSFFANTKYNFAQGGVAFFISNIVRLLTIVAGIWMLINFVLAGLQFISAQGNDEQVKSAWNKIFNSMIGMVIIVVAYALTALLSYLMFGDPAFILNLKITGPGTGE
jgi:hypothetical protein